jgi:uncharacterized membrane protein
MMLTYLAAFAATAVVFLGLDYLWIAVLARDFYRQQLGPLMLEQPNLVAAGIFYVLYVGGILYFAILPALHGGGWATALVAGAVLGLVAYGTYDMTNLATLKSWPIATSFADILWGITLTATAATAGYGVARLASAL